MCFYSRTIIILTVYYSSHTHIMVTLTYSASTFFGSCPLPLRHCNNSCGKNKPLQLQQHIGMAESHLCNVNMPPQTTRIDKYFTGNNKDCWNNDIPKQGADTHLLSCTNRLSSDCLAAAVRFSFSLLLLCWRFKRVHVMEKYKLALLLDKSYDLMKKRCGI